MWILRKAARNSCREKLRLQSWCLLQRRVPRWVKGNVALECWSSAIASGQSYKHEHCCGPNDASQSQSQSPDNDIQCLMDIVDIVFNLNVVYILYVCFQCFKSIWIILSRMDQKQKTTTTNETPENIFFGARWPGARLVPQAPPSQDVYGKTRCLMIVLWFLSMFYASNIFFKERYRFVR